MKKLIFLALAATSPLIGLTNTFTFDEAAKENLCFQDVRHEYGGDGFYTDFQLCWENRYGGNEHEKGFGSLALKTLGLEQESSSPYMLVRRIHDERLLSIPYNGYDGTYIGLALKGDLIQALGVLPPKKPEESANYPKLNEFFGKYCSPVLPDIDPATETLSKKSNKIERKSPERNREST